VLGLLYNFRFTILGLRPICTDDKLGVARSNVFFVLLLPGVAMLCKVQNYLTQQNKGLCLATPEVSSV